MSRTLLFSIACLTLAVSAHAQGAAPAPRWDVAGSIGSFASNPEPIRPYGSDWYHEARFAASVGRYWTSHFKTELEFATTTEGSRFSNRNAPIPGVPSYYPISVQEYFQLNQLSVRAVWQFFDNAWVHPYMFGGVTFDAQRQETLIPEQFFYPDPRSPSTRIPVTPPIQQQETAHLFGTTAGAGAKVYLTKNAFFNGAVVASYTQPRRTVSFTGGFGLDF